MNKIAMLIALLATFLGAASLFLYKKRFEQEAIGGKRVSILVTTQEIPLGSRLTKSVIGSRQVPEVYLDRRQILASDVERVLGVPFRTQMTGDEAILWTDLATSNSESRGLALRIPSSMRAVAVNASARSGFGGLLRPGDRVDVLLTGEKIGRGNDSRITTTLEQNVLVLAIGGSLNGGSGGRGNSTVSLLVSPTQAQNLIFAEDRGAVSLTLRNPDDISKIESLPDATVEQLLQRGASDSRPRDR